MRNKSHYEEASYGPAPASRPPVMNSVLKYLDRYIGLMALVILLAVVFPVQGEGAAMLGLTADIGIICLFFLYGARLSPEEALDGLKNWKLQMAVLLSTFVLFPVLGLVFKGALVAFLPATLISGILYLCVLPSTVQSSIAFTSIARGNIPAALCAASASNIVGVFISPLLAGWLISVQDASISFDVFRDILLQLFAPFVLGQLLRPKVGAWMRANKKMLSYADRGVILLIIYVAFSKGMAENVWAQIELGHLAILAAVLCVLLALVLFITRLIGSRVMTLRVEDEIVLQFCGSKKSLASGMPMAKVLFAGSQLSLIILPLMLFHQLQLIVCAVLARHYSGRVPDRATGAADRCRL